MMKRAVAAFSVVVLWVALSASASATKGDTKKKSSKTDAPRVIYSYSSVHPFIVHALRGCHCHWIDDEFEQRDCKKQCVPFKKKMLAWAAKNPVLHHDLELDVQKYNFKSRSYVLEREDMSTEPESIPGSVIIESAAIWRFSTSSALPSSAAMMSSLRKRIDSRTPLLCVGAPGVQEGST